MRTTLFSTITTLLLMFFVCSCGVPHTSAPEEPQIENIEEPEAPPEEWTAPDPDEGQMTTAEPDEEPIIKGTGKGQNTDEEAVVTSETPNEEGTVPPKKKPDFENYVAILEVTPIIYENKTGQMTVEIKDPNYSANVKKSEKKYATDSTFIPTSIGQYARVTPNAPDFEVTPASAKDTGCILIHPSGSIVTFSLTPKEGKRGKIDVRASIEVYEDEDCKCTKTMVLKKTEILTVEVEIGGFWDRVFDIFREHLYTFLGSLFTLLAAIVLFKIRKKSKIDEKE